MVLARINWVVDVVDVGLGDADTITYGPYGEARAREIVDALNRRLPDGWHAGCYPLAEKTIPELLAIYNEPSVVGRFSEDELDAEVAS